MSDSHESDDTEVHPAHEFGTDVFRGINISQTAANLLGLALCTGPEPFHTCFVGEWVDRTNQSRLADRLQQMVGAEYVNSESAPKRTFLDTLGELDDPILLDNADQFDSTLESLYEPLLRQQYTRVGDQEPQQFTSSVIATAALKPEAIDRYNPLSEQVPFTQTDIAMFDALIVSQSAAPSTTTAPETGRTLETLQDTLEQANTYEPTVPDNDSDPIAYEVEQHQNKLDFTPTELQMASVDRLVHAAARLRHSETVAPEDAHVVLDLLSESASTETDPDDEEMDADLLETGTPQSQRDRVRLTKEILGALGEEHDGHVPFEALADEMVQYDIDEETLKHTLEKLAQKGDVIEPRNNYYSLYGEP